MRKIKILYIIHNLAMGGSERQLTQLLKALNKDKYLPFVGCMGRGGEFLPLLEEMNVPLVLFERKWKYSLLPALKLARWAKKHEIDIIQSFCPTSGVYTTIAGWLTGIKTITGSIRSCSPFPWITKFNIWLSRFSDYQVAISHASLKTQMKHPPKTMSVVYSGIDLDEFHPSDNGFKPPYRIAMLARLHPGKDHISFIEAAKLVLQRRDDVEFYITGVGQTEEYVKRHIAGTNRYLGSNKIIFAGYVHNVAAFMRTLTITVMLNNPAIHLEGINNSTIETVASGVPGIAINLGGTQEVILNGITGFLVDPFDYKAVANKILQLLNRPDMWAKMSWNCRKLAIERFDVRRMVAEYERIYNLCVK